MKSYYLLILFLGISFLAKSQKNKKWSLEVNYGLNGNFFVRSYDELGGPLNKTYLYKKNFLGTVAGLELKYHLNDHSSLIAGYSGSMNKGKKNYSGNINGVDIFITDFNIRHNNYFYQLAYERRFHKLKPLFKYHFGLVLAKMNQQEIMIENYDNLIAIDERNFKNSKLQEGGVFGGIHLQKKIDTNFEFGLRIRAYYLISVNALESITFTPTLSYSF